jgi:hypothetical protein
VSLLEAQPVDPRAESRRRFMRNVLGGLLVSAVLAAPLLWFYRNYPEERAVDRLFTAIEQKDYRKAFAVWTADPEWEQHAARYEDYPFGQFQLDWGPSGDWGEIKTHQVEGSVEPRSKTGTVSGVVVVTRVNNRGEPSCLWVEKKSKQISFSPLPCAF